MQPIPVPKELVNDDAYLVAVLLAEPGEQVVAGQPVAELETSKASLTLHSPGDGCFYPQYAVGQMAPVGAIFGHIARPDAAPAPRGRIDEDADTPDPRFSRAAWELFSANSMDMTAFAGMSHIRRADVETALASSASRPDRDGSGLVLLGGGGHCRECIEAIEQAGKYHIHGIIDTYAKPGTRIAGYPVLGDNSRLESLRREGFRHLVLAYAIAGSQAERNTHFRQLHSLGHDFPAIVHPKAAVNAHAVLGAGIHIMPGAVVGSQAVLGDACIVNSNAVVSHDCHVGDNVHVAPGAVLAGGVRVGENATIGMGATVFMRVSIGSGAVIYNGAHVFSDIPDNTIVKGTSINPDFVRGRGTEPV